MLWYNYLFTILGIAGIIGCFLVGLPAAAKTRNGLAFVYAIMIAVAWAVVIYWNVHGF